MDITTVSDDMIVVHDGLTAHRLVGLAPGTELEFDGVAVRTLDRPPGELLSRFATVNDVHFGEVECGRVGDSADGPIQRRAPGELPYPETMNRGAVAEMSTVALDAVFVKGDLSQDGRPEEWEAFEACYRGAFGSRLHVVRGNHDAYHGQTEYAGDQWVELAGVAVALMDTTIPTHTTGHLTADQLEWLDEHAARADRPVVVMGHHQQWTSGNSNGNDTRSDDYFGLHPDPSDALTELTLRRRSVVAYTAGHTHRHRRRILPTGVPTVEIGCVKDFPGTWAEYRVYEGGLMQVVHRVSTPDALQWSEQCRHLYRDFGVDYETYTLGDLSDRCFTIGLR